MTDKKLTDGLNDRPKNAPIGQIAEGFPDDSAQPIETDEMTVAGRKLMQKPSDKDDAVEGRQNMRPPEMDLEPIPTDTELEDQGSSSGLNDSSDTLHDPSSHERSAGSKRSDRKGSRQGAEERVEGLPDASLDERSIVSTPPALD